MRRLLFSLLVVGVVFALAYGAAASLNVNGGVLQAGKDEDLTCDTNGVNVSYTVAWQNNQFKVTKVTVSDVNNAPPGQGGCRGKKLQVVLTFSAGSPIQLSAKTINANNSSYSWSSPSDFSAFDASTLTDVHVAIY